MVVRREAYEAAGGFGPPEPGNATSGAAADVVADVGFGRRLAATGWRVAVTPHAELLHHECEHPVGGAPVTVTIRGWNAEDPSGNPNLSSDDRSPAWPPRVGLG
jgi:hypothetical protein